MEPATSSYTQWIVGIIVIVLLAVGAWYLIPRSGTGTAPGTAATSTSAVVTATSTTPTSTHTPAASAGKATLPPPPSLTRAIPATSPDLDAAGRAQVIADIQTATAAMQHDLGSAQNWLNLGVLRQMLGDYQGAADAFEYAALLAPKADTPFANLGYLYTVYLPNYPKAEADFRIAITNDPHNINTYKNFFELYRYHYKQGTSAAADILKQGIAANPTDTALKATLQDYEQGTI